MPNPETSPGANAQLTAEQATILQVQGLDASSAEAMAAGLPGDELPLPYPPQAEQITRAQAVEHMATIEQDALNESPASPNYDAFRRTEEVQKNQFVRAARQEVEDAFGVQAVEEATERGIEGSKVVTKNAHEIAAAVSQDKATLASEDHTLSVDTHDITSQSDTKEQYARLKDKVNGNADHITGQVATRARHAMQRFGISKRQRDLQAEVVEAAGADITRDKESMDIEQELVGEALVSSLVDNKPHINDTARQEIVDKLKKDRGAIKDLGNAMHYYRRGGRSLTSFRQVARKLNHL